MISSFLNDLTRIDDDVVGNKRQPLGLYGCYTLEPLAYKSMPGNSFVLKACDKTFLQLLSARPRPPEDSFTQSHTLSYMHTETHTYSFSMGCMQDYTYCTESCWSYTTGAGIALESPTWWCEMWRQTFLSQPHPQPSSRSNTACGIFPVSSVSCAGAETPRWRCVIARYCMLK